MSYFLPLKIKYNKDRNQPVFLRIFYYQYIIYINIINLCFTFFYAARGSNYFFYKNKWHTNCYNINI